MDANDHDEMNIRRNIPSFCTRCISFSAACSFCFCIYVFRAACSSSVIPILVGPRGSDVEEAAKSVYEPRQIWQGKDRAFSGARLGSLRRCGRFTAHRAQHTRAVGVHAGYLEYCIARDPRLALVPLEGLAPRALAFVTTSRRVRLQPPLPPFTSVTLQLGAPTLLNPTAAHRSPSEPKSRGGV